MVIKWIKLMLLIVLYWWWWLWWCVKEEGVQENKKGHRLHHDLLWWDSLRRQTVKKSFIVKVVPESSFQSQSSKPTKGHSLNPFFWMQRRSRIGFGGMVSCASKKIIKKKILLWCVQCTDTFFFTEKEEIKIVEVACLLRASWCCVDLNGCKTVILTEESHAFSTPHTHTHTLPFLLYVYL